MVVGQLRAAIAWPSHGQYGSTVSPARPSASLGGGRWPVERAESIACLRFQYMSTRACSHTWRQSMKYRNWTSRTRRSIRAESSGEGERVGIAPVAAAIWNAAIWNVATRARTNVPDCRAFGHLRARPSQV